MEIELPIIPVAKPRMTRRDKWKPRKIVNRYWIFKDHINYLCNAQKFVLADAYKVVFYIPFPKSYSKKKSLKLVGQPHKLRPDLDNFVKSINDCLKNEDSTIYKIESSKYWAYEPKIYIKNLI